MRKCGRTSRKENCFNPKGLVAGCQIHSWAATWDLAAMLILRMFLPHSTCCMMQGDPEDGPVPCKSSRLQAGMRFSRRPLGTPSHRFAAVSPPQTSSPRTGSWHPGAAADLRPSRMTAHSRSGHGGPCSALPAPASSRLVLAGKLTSTHDQHHSIMRFPRDYCPWRSLATSSRFEPASLAGSLILMPI